MNNFLLGVKYLLEGFKLIAQPGLRRYVIIPLFINICLYISLFFLLKYFMSEFNSWFALHLPSWLKWLSLILWLLFLIAFSGIIIYTFVTFANLICAPF